MGIAVVAVSFTVNGHGGHKLSIRQLDLHPILSQ